jgi:hypothetical protein
MKPSDLRFEIDIFDGNEISVYISSDGKCLMSDMKIDKQMAPVYDMLYAIIKPMITQEMVESRDTESLYEAISHIRKKNTRKALAKIAEALSELSSKKEEAEEEEFKCMLCQATYPESTVEGNCGKCFGKDTVFSKNSIDKTEKRLLATSELLKQEAVAANEAYKLKAECNTSSSLAFAYNEGERVGMQPSRNQMDMSGFEKYHKRQMTFEEVGKFIEGRAEGLKKWNHR